MTRRYNGFTVKSLGSDRWLLTTNHRANLVIDQQTLENILTRYYSIIGA